MLSLSEKAWEDLVSCWHNKVAVTWSPLNRKINHIWNRIDCKYYKKSRTLRFTQMLMPLLRKCDAFFCWFCRSLCRNCRLSSLLLVMSVFYVKSFDWCSFCQYRPYFCIKSVYYRNFLSVSSVSICVKYKKVIRKLGERLCSGAEGG